MSNPGAAAFGAATGNRPLSGPRPPVLLAAWFRSDVRTALESSATISTSTTTSTTPEGMLT